MQKFLSSIFSVGFILTFLGLFKPNYISDVAALVLLFSTFFTLILYKRNSKIFFLMMFSLASCLYLFTRGAF